MSLVPFKELMDDAESGGYAVGYFEAWSLDSLLAIADAATRKKSPVLLGFSGIYLPQAESDANSSLARYAALGLEICRQIPVPTCLIFNESPHMDWVRKAIDLQFGLVMFSDPELKPKDQIDRVRTVVQKAHASRVAVEGEPQSLAGVAGELSEIPQDLHLTGPKQALEFVEATNVDALAVNVGQAHVHGRRLVPLNLSRLAEIGNVVSVPLVLHGGTSIRHEDIPEAIRLGVRKINIGSVLKKTYFEALREKSENVGADYNPYDVVGSGLDQDVLAAARRVLINTVENLMVLYRSAGKS